MSNLLAERRSVVDINIELDEQDREDAILTVMSIAESLEDATSVMLAAERIAIDDTAEHFDNEQDPDGNPWMELTEDYWAWKMSMGGIDKTLQFYGDLKAAATAPGAWLVTEDSLIFNTAVLPSYGTLHQTGTGNPSNWHKREHEGTKTQVGLGIGRGNALPMRPFIGLSVTAEERINALFDAWFTEATSGVYIRTSGIAQHRTAGGQFGTKI